VSKFCPTGVCPITSKSNFKNRPLTTIAKNI
jgi:hypothetical protein